MCHLSIKTSCRASHDILLGHFELAHDIFEKEVESRKCKPLRVVQITDEISKWPYLSHDFISGNRSCKQWMKLFFQRLFVNIRRIKKSFSELFFHLRNVTTVGYLNASIRIASHRRRVLVLQSIRHIVFAVLMLIYRSKWIMIKY